MSTTTPFVVQEAHAPRIRSNADLDVQSGGFVALSLPGASRALEVSTDETTTTLDSSENTLSIQTPVFELSGEHGGFEAGASISIRAGEEEPDISSLLATSSDASMGTTDATRLAFSVPETSLFTAETLIRQTDNGTRYRALDQNIAVGDNSIVTMGADKITFHVDVDIDGTLNNIGGDQLITQVEDPVIQIATGADTEADIGAGPVGVQIDTVPSDVSSVNRMSQFTATDGSPLFLDGSGAIDVAKAAASGVFTKQVAWNANGGTRELAQKSAASRLSEPAWDIAGGQVRMLRYVPDAGTPGRVYMYAIIMRVTDAGNFEVSRMKQAMNWDAGAGGFVGSEPEYAILQEAVSELAAYAASFLSQTGDSLALTFEHSESVDPVAGPFVSMDGDRKIFTWKGAAPMLRARIATPIRTNAWSGFTMLVRARVEAPMNSARFMVMRGSTGEYALVCKSDIGETSNQHSAFFYNDVEPATRVQSSAGSIPENAWTVLAVTFTRASSEAQMFIDGTPVSSNMLTTTFHDYIHDVTITRSVGFRGSISHAFMWPRALTAEEVQTETTSLSA